MTITSRVPELIRVPGTTVTANGQTTMALPTLRTTTAQVRVREDFFVAEPELDVRLRLARTVRLTGGVGYRLIGAGHRGDSRLRGAVGSIALQIGGGF